jgi:hypothetical protein
MRHGRGACGGSFNSAATESLVQPGATRCGRQNRVHCSEPRRNLVLDKTGEARQVDLKQTRQIDNRGGD